MAAKKGVAKTPQATVRCRALLIRMELEDVNADGQVIGESVTKEQRLFPAFWPAISQQVKAAVAQVNAQRAKA